MKQDHGQVTMPDTFHTIELQQPSAVVDVSGDVLLLPSSLGRTRLSKIERLTKQSMHDHRQTLEGRAGPLSSPGDHIARLKAQGR